MLIGITPFNHKNRQTMMNKIKNAKVVFPDRKKYNFQYSEEIQDFIIKLLKKDRSKRLGTADDSEEVLKHKVFENIDVEALTNKSIEAPYKPEFEEQTAVVSKNSRASFLQGESNSAEPKRDVFENFDRQTNT